VWGGSEEVGFFHLGCYIHEYLDRCCGGGGIGESGGPESAGGLVVSVWKVGRLWSMAAQSLMIFLMPSDEVASQRPP
jgi:hypothetical protein